MTNLDIATYYDEFLPEMVETKGRHRFMFKTFDEFVRQGMAILDVGCGAGVTSKYLADLGATVDAVDISPKAIEFAKEHNPHENITYINDDICKPKIMNDKKYNMIVFADVLEHLPKGSMTKALLFVLGLNTDKTSMIYLNIPDVNFQQFMLANYPEKQQMIDEGYAIKEILSVFDFAGFVPIRIQIYGLDTHAQYNEYLFVKKEILSIHYTTKLMQIYKEVVQ